MDEADRLADEKSFEEVGKIIRLMNGGDEVNHQAKNNRQTFIFSATLTMMHKLPTRLQTDTKNVVSLAFSFKFYRGLKTSKHSLIW